MQGKGGRAEADGGDGLRLLPFQRAFQRAALDPALDVAAMSGPRSLGKTYLAGRLLARCLTPGDPIHVPGADYILIAASLEQARLTLGFVRPALEPLGGFSFLDSAQRIAYRHRPTRDPAPRAVERREDRNGNREYPAGRVGRARRVRRSQGRIDGGCVVRGSRQGRVAVEADA